MAKVCRPTFYRWAQIHAVILAIIAGQAANIFVHQSVTSVSVVGTAHTMKEYGLSI